MATEQIELESSTARRASIVGAPLEPATARPNDAAPPSAESQPPQSPWRTRMRGYVTRKNAIIASVSSLSIVIASYFFVPVIYLAWNTASTDDAYVNGHVTFVAARVAGQVTDVLVDDNYRVKKGDVLVRLDKEPYQVQVALKRSLLATAETELEVTAAQVTAMVAQSRSSRFQLEHAIETVRYQIAQLQAAVAALDSDLAIQERSLKDYQRSQEIAKTPGAISPQEIDLRLQEYQVAKAKVRQTLQGALQIRAGLGLSDAGPIPVELTSAPSWLADTPADLDQTFSTVRQASAELMQSLAPLGVQYSSYSLKPEQLLQNFLSRDPEKNIDRIYAKIVEQAPSLAEARAKVTQAQRDLDQALLDLRYTDVVAEIDGVVTRRNINPGNNVQAGQSVMAIRSLTDIWIDANFKETQLANLRIGQPVRLEVDMYGSRQEFNGRITGFTMGTGPTLSLLPPQNATGNYVKIVQRLPVRIELDDYDPDHQPLFVGLSATPYVYIYKPLVGNDPGKGQTLQPFRTQRGVK